MRTWSRRRKASPSRRWARGADLQARWLSTRQYAWNVASAAFSQVKWVRMRCPYGVCATSGWNCTPARALARSSNAATGARPEAAVTAYPWDGAVRYCVVWVKDAAKKP